MNEPEAGTAWTFRRRPGVRPRTLRTWAARADQGEGLAIGSCRPLAAIAETLQPNRCEAQTAAIGAVQDWRDRR